MEFSKYLQVGVGGNLGGKLIDATLHCVYESNFWNLRKVALSWPLSSRQGWQPWRRLVVMNGTKRVSDDAIANLTRCKVFS